MEDSTVIALKMAFLRTQITTLSQALQVDARQRDERGLLSETVIANATREVNRMVKQHNKAVYSELAIRHIADQIDHIYYTPVAVNYGLSGSEEPEIGEDMILREGDDFTRDAFISLLPSSSEDASDLQRRQTNESDVSNCVVRSRELKELSQRRALLRKRIDKLQALRLMLEPFSNPAKDVQPNVTTRDGTIATQLEEMKELSVRVGARLSVTDRKTHQTDNDGDILRNTLQFDRAQRLRDVWDTD